jgi:hypothetical protein
MRPRSAVSAALLGGALMAASLAASSLRAPARAAAPWWDEAQVGVRVNEHAFSRVTANGAGCSVRLRLHFDAPRAKYAEPAAERNHFRFRASVLLSDGASVQSEIFDNAEPGARVYAFSRDTAPEGCWAERAHTLRKLDVHACRGVRCVPEAFE